MNRPFEVFQYCPKCGRGPVSPPLEPVVRCAACGFVFFFNPAAAAGAFLHDHNGRLLFLRRAKDPARGKLALAGGFVDYHETAEAGLRREIREEIGLEVGHLGVGSHQRHSSSNAGFPWGIRSRPTGRRPQRSSGRRTRIGSPPAALARVPPPRPAPSVH